MVSMLERGNDMLSRLRLRFLGVQTYALVGESGTGKSFHAQSAAMLLNCRYIVDDGLLIMEQRILAGKTAKNEDSPLKAVRRAIFEDEDHAHEVREEIRKRHVDRIMVIGTSDKMAARICGRLGLPSPARFIRIEDLIRPEELQVARRTRTYEGKHVIPAPQVEVKKVFSHAIVASFSQLLSSYRHHRDPSKTLEKSVVRPGFYLGRISISESAIESLIRVVMEQKEPVLNVRHVRVNLNEGRMEVLAEVAVPLSDNLPQYLNQLQHLVFSQVQQVTGMHVDRVDMNVVDVLPPPEEVAEESLERLSRKKKRKFLGGGSKAQQEEQGS